MGSSEPRCYMENLGNLYPDENTKEKTPNLFLSTLLFRSRGQGYKRGKEGIETSIVLNCPELTILLLDSRILPLLLYSSNKNVYLAQTPQTLLENKISAI